MPTLKKIIRRLPELITNSKFRRDASNRLVNATKVRTRNAIKHTRRMLSKADRYTLQVLSETDKLIGSGDFQGAEKLLLEAASRYPKDTRKINQKTLFAWLAFSDKRALISIKSRIEKHQEYREEINEYRKSVARRPVGALKIAVVSAISGGYDTPKLPAKLDSRLDYFLYTDSKIWDVGVFNVRPLPYIDGDQTRSARYVKTNVHRLFPEYEFVVWVDANIMILGDLYPLIERVMNSKSGLGAMRHPLRRTPYEEGDACIQAKRGDIIAITDQLKYYKSISYSSNDLLETNILVYNLKDESVHQFLNSWWNEIDTKSKRDQISVNYCLDKNKVKWCTITEWPVTARNHSSFALTRHGSDKGAHMKLEKHLTTKAIDPLSKNTYPNNIIALTSASNISTDIIYCVHNALSDVKKCLTSVKKYIEPRQRLIIIDDGSDVPTKEYLEKFTTDNGNWVTLQRADSPSGYTKAANRGLRLSNADFSILLNSDTIVTKGWAKKLTYTAFKFPDIGIIGPLSSAASQQSIPSSKNQINQTATNELPIGLTADKINKMCEEESRYELMPRVPLVHGFCFGIKRTVIEKVGYFDEKAFPRGYGEENDYCFRAANAGFGLMIATDTYIFHAKSKSYIGPDRIALMDAGMKSLVKKHGQHRITRSVKTMEQNPYLARMRKAAQALYDSSSG